MKFVYILKDDPLKSKLSLTIMPIFFIAIAYLSLEIKKSDIEKANASETWPTTDGKIISSINRKVDYRTKSKRVVYHTPEIRFEYTVDERDFSSDKIWTYTHSSNQFTKEEVDEFIANYKEGESVKVYYNPDDNYEALLIPGNVKNETTLVHSLVLLSIPLYFILVGFLRGIKLSRLEEEMQKAKDN